MNNDYLSMRSRNIFIYLIKWRVVAGAAVCLSAGLAAADAPSASSRPLVRPDAQQVQPLNVTLASANPAASVSAPKASEATARAPLGADMRPRSRNGLFAATVQPSDSAVAISRQVTRVRFDAHSRPNPRPPHPLAEYSVHLASAMVSVAPGAPKPQARPAFFGKIFKKRDGAGNYSAKGSVCGVNAIKGVKKPGFGNPARGCGIANPVQVTSVSGVALSRPATIDCTTAKALNTWVSKGIKPAVGKRGGGLAELDVVADFACRTRNNRPGGKLSEHARGHAVDVAGVRLKDGTEVTVLNGWRSSSYSKMMRSIHRSACGPFGTVLGPNADRYHQDHFHVDTARYRSGTYCR